MLKAIRHLGSTVADYTVGTVIVMVHMARAERKSQPRLPGRA